MAKDVERALIDVVAEHGARPPERGGAFVAELKKSGRYQSRCILRRPDAGERALAHPVRSATPPRMAALARLPVFFALAGKRGVLAGGTPAAAWKAELLSAAGATRRRLRDRDVGRNAALAAEPPRGAIVVHARAWAAEDFAGAAIAVGAFDDDERGGALPRPRARPACRST